MKKLFIVFFILIGISVGAKAQVTSGGVTAFGFSQINPANGAPGTHTAIIYCTEPRTVKFNLISGGFSSAVGQAECYFKVGGNIVYHTKVNTIAAVTILLSKGDNHVEVGMMYTAGGISVSGTYLNVLIDMSTLGIPGNFGYIPGVDTALYFTN